MIWFFGKRLAAIRIVERVFDDIKTPRATEVIEMIVLGINQVPERQLPVQVRAIIVATGLWNNPTAVGRLMMVGPISAQEAVHFLRDIGRAALELARKEGFSEAFSVPAGRERAEQLGVRWDNSGLTDRRPVADATTAAPLSPSQRPSAKSSNVAQQSGSSIEPSVPLYDISNEMPSDAFVECWQAAQQHLNRMVQDGIQTWLKGAPTPPFREHLSFRLGNQLFLIRIENAAGQLVVPSTRMGLLAAADDFGGWPCIISMTRARNGRWEPTRPGWGLVDARDDRPIDPFALVSDEEVEMTDGELHHFAVQVVEQQLVSTGVKVSASQGNLGVDPAIWIKGKRGPEWVVVRATRYPRKRAVAPRHWDSIVERCGGTSVPGHFASVSVARADANFADGDPSPGRLLRGHGMHVRYAGLEQVEGHHRVVEGEGRHREAAPTDLRPTFKGRRAASSEYSGFLHCVESARAHLNALGDGLDMEWLRSRTHEPVVEHLSFRLGNQLYFVQVQDVERRISEPSSVDRLFSVASDANGWACLMPMRRQEKVWVPDCPEWGLIDARTGSMIGPSELCTDELIEMTPWEVHDFAVRFVCEELRKQGHPIRVAASDPNTDPSITFVQNGDPESIVVRESIYPDAVAGLPNNWTEIVKEWRELGASADFYFASVLIVPRAVQQRQDKRLLRGQKLHALYEGLRKPTEEEIASAAARR